MIMSGLEQARCGWVGRLRSLRHERRARERSDGHQSKESTEGLAKGSFKRASIHRILQRQRSIIPNPLAVDVKGKRHRHHSKRNERNQAISPSQPEPFVQAQTGQRQKSTDDGSKNRDCSCCGGGVEGVSIDNVLLEDTC